MQILLTFGCFFVAGIVLIYAKKCSQQPEICAKRFISDFGVPESFFAIPYTGDVETARKAILSDQDLRRKYIFEQYVIAALIVVGGILILFVQM